MLQLASQQFTMEHNTVWFVMEGNLVYVFLKEISDLKIPPDYGSPHQIISI